MGTFLYQKGEKKMNLYLFFFKSTLSCSISGLSCSNLRQQGKPSGKGMGMMGGSYEWLENDGSDVGKLPCSYKDACIWFRANIQANMFIFFS